MKKRLILFSLIIILLIGLAGCGEKKKEPEPVSTKEEKSDKKEEKEPEEDDVRSEVTESDSEEPEVTEEKSESNKTPEPVDISVYAGMYYDYLSTNRSDIDFDYNDYDYNFIYLDNDDIPEIYFSGGLATGSGLFYISQGEIKREWTSGDGEYISGSGLWHCTNGEGGFNDIIYQLADGNIKELAVGHGLINPEYGGENWWELLDYWWAGNKVTNEQYEELNEMFTVSWCGTEATFEEYEHYFNELFDKTRAIPCYEYENGYSFDEVLSLLRTAAGRQEFSDSWSVTNNSPFYGIWCVSSKDHETAEKAAVLLAEQGFNGQVFITTDWSNLNSEMWYVVTAGVYPSKEEADATLSAVRSLYPDAYIKYSGDWIGTN